MGTWLNSLGAEERSQLTAHLTGTRRLLTGTLLPHLSLAPDDLKVHGLVAQLKPLSANCTQAEMQDTYSITV
jgi:hypothetical protein